MIHPAINISKPPEHSEILGFLPEIETDYVGQSGGLFYDLDDPYESIRKATMLSEKITLSTTIEAFNMFLNSYDFDFNEFISAIENEKLDFDAYGKYWRFKKFIKVERSRVYFEIKEISYDYEDLDI